MKILKLSSLLLMTFLFVVGFAPKVEAKNHGHYHKHKYRSSAFSFNLNLFDTPRYYVEQERIVYPQYVQQQVIYPPAYYTEEVIVQRPAPIVVRPAPVVRQQVLYHPHYDYWRY